jgi:hypothetical protein
MSPASTSILRGGRSAAASRRWTSHGHNVEVQTPRSPFVVERSAAGTYLVDVMETSVVGQRIGSQSIEYGKREPEQREGGARGC